MDWIGLDWIILDLDLDWMDLVCCGCANNKYGINEAD